MGIDLKEYLPRYVNSTLWWRLPLLDIPGGPTLNQSMSRYVVGWVVVLLVLPGPVWAVEAAPALTDREIVERLTRLEEGQNGLREAIQQLRAELGQLRTELGQLRAGHDPAESAAARGHEPPESTAA